MKMNLKYQLIRNKSYTFLVFYENIVSKLF